MLKTDGMIEDAVKRYRFMEQTVVLGRGFNYCTAYEWALKMKEMTHICKDLNGELMFISNKKEAFDMAITPVELPADIPEWLSPIAAIIPAQLFVYHLACVKGHYPDNPRIIHKMTETK